MTLAGMGSRQRRPDGQVRRKYAESTPELHRNCTETAPKMTPSKVFWRVDQIPATFGDCVSEYP
jgi:hypothetical protein